MLGLNLIHISKRGYWALWLFNALCIDHAKRNIMTFTLIKANGLSQKQKTKKHQRSALLTLHEGNLSLHRASHA